MKIIHYSSLNFSSWVNSSQKARCDGYDQDGNDTMTCSAVLKVNKNDKIKFVMASSGPIYQSVDYFTYVEAGSSLYASSGPYTIHFSRCKICHEEYFLTN